MSYCDCEDVGSIPIYHLYYKIDNTLLLYDMYLKKILVFDNL